MTASQQQALASLLQDSDAGTVGMVKGKLIEGGHERISEYRALLRVLRGPAHASLLEVIDQIEASQVLGDLSRSIARLRTLDQVEQFCWDFVRTEQPEFDGRPYSRQLDSWAAEAGRLIVPGARPEEKIRCLSRYLGQEQGLNGNSADYYNPRNACLPWVMEFRVGLPITVTLIYMLVGARLGLNVEGIGAPGHFLARLEGVIFDPYYGGVILTDAQWELIASEIPARQRPYLSRACTPEHVVHRMLINLRNCYVKRGDVERRKMVDHYLAVLQR